MSTDDTMRKATQAELFSAQLGRQFYQMLILGISTLEQLNEQFASLVEIPTQFPLMVVYRPSRDGV